MIKILKQITGITLGVVLVLSGCSSEESDTANFFDDSNVKIKETTASNVIVGSDFKIDRKFLEERYPGKTILEYIYKDWEIIYNSGETYTKKQIIALNDYLVENGQDYVIYFRPLNDEEGTSDNVVSMVNGENPPDIISAFQQDDFFDEGGTYYPTEDLIDKGVFANLDEYKNTGDYKKYVSSVPQEAYRLSLFNDVFYGFKSGTFSKNLQVYIYNEELAEKYGIKPEDLENKSISEIYPYVEKVARGESEEKDFHASSVWPGNSMLFLKMYVKDFTKKEEPYLTSIGVDAEEEGGIIAITESETQKQEWKAFYELIANGYEEVANSTEVEGEMNYEKRKNVFIFQGYNHTLNANFDDLKEDYGKLNKVNTVLKGEFPVHEASGATLFTGICSKSKNKETAFKALAFIYGSSDASNILINGPDSINYDVKDITFTDEDIAESRNWRRSYMGNCYIIKDEYGNEDSVIEKAESLKGSEIRDDIEGYYFNLENVEEQAWAIDAIEYKYLDEDSIRGKKTGFFDSKYKNFDEAWAGFEKELKDAGIDEVLAEFRRQYDEYNGKKQK